MMAFFALTIGSIVRLWWLAGTDSEVSRRHRSSLAVWWILLLTLTLASALGRLGLAAMFGVVGVMSLHEFNNMLPVRSRCHWLFRTSLALCVFQFACLALNQLHIARTFPVVALLALTMARIAATQVSTSEIESYSIATARYYWACILLVFGLSHVVMLVEVPYLHWRWDLGVVGYSILVILATELSDITQALVGRKFGRHKIVPYLSPGKSWEGLAGGIASTCVLFVVLSPWLLVGVDKPLALRWLETAVLGVAVAVSGFLGDLNMSGIKREAHLKDSSQLLPGMGGILDRIDSLTFTAPVFYGCLQMLGEG